MKDDEIATLKADKEHMQHRLSEVDKKTKKINDLNAENRRKHKLLVEKSKDCTRLSKDAEMNKQKAQERDQIFTKNKEIMQRNIHY